MTTYAHASSKLGMIEPATAAIAREVWHAAASAGVDVWFMWGVGSSAEHRTGRALDFMVRLERDGDWIRDYLWKHRERLRVIHIIWWQHIVSTEVRPGVRVRMEDRGNSTANHYDHVHLYLRSGTYRGPGTTAERPAMQLNDKINLRTGGDVTYSAEQTTVAGILTSTNYYTVLTRNHVTALRHQVDDLESAVDELRSVVDELRTAIAGKG